MEIFLAIFIIALFIGITNGIKGLCRSYIEKHNNDKTAN